MDKAYAFFAASNEPLSVHSMDSDTVVHKMDMVMDVSSIPRYISAVRRCVASKVSQRISGWKQSFPYSGESGDTRQPGSCGEQYQRKRSLRHKHGLQQAA